MENEKKSTNIPVPPAKAEAKAIIKEPTPKKEEIPKETKYQPGRITRVKG